MKVLKPQRLRPSDYSDMRKQLEVLFYELVFKPVVDLLAPHNAQVRAAAKELRNAIVAPVVAAVRSGRIQYVGSTFSGNFNAEISKALKSYGATYNKRQGTFTIMEQDLPLEVLTAVNEYADESEKLHDALSDKLDEIQRGLEKAIKDSPVDASELVVKMEGGFNSAYGEAIGKEELSDRAKKKLTEDYSDNMELWIKKWSEESIRELRTIVEENAAAGYRFDVLVDKIQNRYDVSRTKAEFLARQETSLFISKHRQQKFEDAGVTSYIWQTAGDARVREDHAKLDGREFEYANPPIIDESTGMKGNPGEGFNCLPGDSPINFADGVRKGVVRKYSGRMTEFVTVSGRAVRLTPNHQVLTSRGWKESQFLNIGDEVINLSSELLESPEGDKDHRVLTIGQIVESLARPSPFFSFANKRSPVDLDSNFIDRHVYVVRPTLRLMIRIKSMCLQGLEKFIFSLSNFANFGCSTGDSQSLKFSFGGVSSSDIRFVGDSLSLFKGREFHPREHSLATIANGNSELLKFAVQGTSGDSGSFFKSKEPFSFFVRFYKWLRIEFFFIPISRIQLISNSILDKNPMEAITRTAEVLGNEISRYFRPSHFDRIVDVRSFKFSGHVYNLETKNNWYCSDGIILHNCRCVANPILPGVLSNA